MSYLTNSGTNLKENDATFKNILSFELKEGYLAWFPPIIRQLYQKDESLSQKLDKVLELLHETLEDISLDVDKGNCPTCSIDENIKPLSVYYTRINNIMTTGSVVLPIKLRYYHCKHCSFIPNVHHNLTLPYGSYDRGLVQYGVAMYVSGCSLELTKNLLYSIFHIQIVESTILRWVQDFGKKALEINQESFKSLRKISIEWDEFYVSIRDRKNKGEHTPAFTTEIHEHTVGAWLYTGVNEGSQTNILIVTSHLKQMEVYDPTLGIADGCSSYPTATKEALPNMAFKNDSVHAVRNKRKKPATKALFKEKKKEFEEQIRKQWNYELEKEREEFMTDLNKLDIQTKSKKKLEQAKKKELEDWKKWEELEIQALEEYTKEEGKYYQQRMHRQFFAGYQAARVAREKESFRTSEVEQFNSCKTEGFNRVRRSRERKRLCYRSTKSFFSVSCLLGLLHNMMGTGEGCLYDILGATRPPSDWNPFFEFQLSKKTNSIKNLANSTPIRYVKTKYRQQHSSLAFPPVNVNSYSSKTLHDEKSLEGSLM